MTTYFIICPAPNHTFDNKPTYTCFRAPARIRTLMTYTPNSSFPTSALCLHIRLILHSKFTQPPFRGYLPQSPFQGISIFHCVNVI